METMFFPRVFKHQLKPAPTEPECRFRPRRAFEKRKSTTLPPEVYLRAAGQRRSGSTSTIPRTCLFSSRLCRELENRGFEILLTARDTYQVCDLLKFHKLSCKVVGRHYGKNKLMKVLGNCLRTAQLLPMVGRFAPISAFARIARSNSYRCGVRDPHHHDARL